MPRPQLSKTSRALRDFLATETASGLLLVTATAVALVWANSPWRASYDAVWHTEFGVRIGRYGVTDDLRHWVNDGLMAVFFLVVGLEVKRELVIGELRERRHAALPVFAAVGGMVVPALVFLAVNPAAPAARGWGIPMATDIAFALGVLALVAPRVPAGVRLFLLALAIVDDIGAIVVIAVFYSSDVEAGWLAVAVLVVALVVVLRRASPVSTPVFVALGVGLWLAVRAAGVHATLAGVVMGLLAPTTAALSRAIVRTRADDLLDVFSPQAAKETTRLAKRSVSELEWLEHGLHPWSSLLIVPIFALANAGIELTGNTVADGLGSPVTLGIVAALVVGKLVGITAGAWTATRLRVAALPEGVTWSHIVGAAALGGVGFTVSLFITDLAFRDDPLGNEAKVGVIAASVIASALGAALVRRSTR